jgi:hypothetical protein
MRDPDFELFCQLMYAEYCDEKAFNKEMPVLRYSEYRIRNVIFLRKEFEERYGSVSTVHPQE